jgi:hypothetical protein
LVPVRRNRIGFSRGWEARARRRGPVVFCVGLLVLFIGFCENNLVLVWVGIALEFVGGGIMAWQRGQEVKKTRSVSG